MKKLVLIEMEMPETCFDCPCRDTMPHLNKCRILNIFLESSNFRPVWCPLIEVKEN